VLPTTCQGGSAILPADAVILITGGVGSLYICSNATNTWVLIGIVSPPGSPNGIPQSLTSTPSGGNPGPEIWLIPGVQLDAQTGTSYTIPITDDVKLITGNNGSATAWTGFTLANNYVFACGNLGAGLITYTPASGLIYPGGTGTAIIPQNAFCLQYTDNANTYLFVMPTLKSFPSCPNGGEGFNAATGLFSCNNKLRCESGLGDGLNAITAATYLQTFCYNDSGVTWTLTGIKCFTDNSGTSTLNATNGAGTGLLTGAVTCTTAFAAGTQSGTTTIAAGDFIKFTFVADGTSKQTTWVVSMTQ